MLSVRYLARSIAHKSREQHPNDWDDLEQAGLAYLCKVIDRWDECRGSFGAFAYTAIRSGIREANMQMTWRRQAIQRTDRELRPMSDARLALEYGYGLPIQGDSGSYDRWHGKGAPRGRLYGRLSPSRDVALVSVTPDLALSAGARIESGALTSDMEGEP